MLTELQPQRRPDGRNEERLSMARYYFYSADLYTRDATQLTGGFHGVLTVDDDAKSASDVFGEVADASVHPGDRQEYRPTARPGPVLFSHQAVLSGGLTRAHAPLLKGRGCTQ